LSGLTLKGSSEVLHVKEGRRKFSYLKVKSSSKR